MEKALKVIRELKEKQCINEFAIRGGIAVLYYTEPLLTYDLDIFFIPIDEKKIDVLAPVYKFLSEKGFKPQKEYIHIEGVPVQFIPVYNELVRKAVLNSIEVLYGKIKTRIIRLEYLAAIMLQVYRAKDRERLIKIFEDAEVNEKELFQILDKFKLKDRYKDFRRKFFE